MATKPAKPDGDADATAVFPPKKNPDPAGQQTENLQYPQAAPPAPDATELLPGPSPSGTRGTSPPPNPEDATGIYQPPPAATVDGLAPAPSDATAEFFPPAPRPTGLFTPDKTQPVDSRSEAAAADADRTGIYLPGATQPPAVLSRNRPEATGLSEGTGAYFPPENSPESATEDGSTRRPSPGGATGDYQQTFPAAPAKAAAGRKRPDGDASQCGRYILRKFHARGGMGEIWMAEDPAIGRSVALKRMLKSGRDKEYRFRVEAQVTGQLEHPGIVPIHELGQNEDGHPFYVMKFVHGRTLQQVIEDHFKAAQKGEANREVEHLRLLQIFVSLCQTVAYAHSRGVLHRDLKPENVMLGPYGETLLLDWGIAKVMGQPETPTKEGENAYVQLQDGGVETGTQVGSIMGSPSYMAPEVALGKTTEVDQRSDVYLLGATLFEILTGRRPRLGKSVMEIIKQAQNEPPVPPRQVNPLVPRALDAICLKAMAYQKEGRYATALELAEDLQRYMAGEPVSAYREGFLARSWRWGRRHRKALVRVGVGAFIAGLVGVGIILLREAEERRLADVALEKERRQQKERDNERLKALEKARRQVAAFRRLAEEARFYAATTDPVAEHSPYFDPRKGEAAIKSALALAAPWGQTVEDLPLAKEQGPLKKDIYDLILLLVHTQGRQAPGKQAGQEMLALLDWAGRLASPTRGYYRLRSQANQGLGEEKKATADRERADDPKTPATALDHFLLAEQFRTDSASRPGEQTEERKAWQPDSSRMEKALEQYRQALGIDPKHYWSHFQLARCYLALGRIAEAVESLGACVALRPEDPWGYSVRGLALAQQKRYAEAEMDLDQAVKLSPDFRPARLNRGVVFWMQQKQGEALADFKAVLEPPKEKRLVEAAFYRGQLYLQQAKIKDALADFEQLVTANPAFRPVYRVRARVFIGQGDILQGLKDLDAYLGEGKPLDPAAWQTHGLRGNLLRQMFRELPLKKQSEDSSKALANLAVTELKKAVSQGAKAALVFDDLGAMLESTGQLDEALAAYSQGLALTPRDVKLLIKRGWLFDQKGQHDKALADFAAAARIEPENAEAHTGVGYEKALRKLSPEAQREGDLALLHGGDNYLILHNVACIHSALSQTGGTQAEAHQELAIALLRRAVKLWKRAGTGPSEIELIKGEPAFLPLRDRADFQELIRGEL